MSINTWHLHSFAKGKIFFQNNSTLAHWLGEGGARQEWTVTHLNHLVKDVYAVGTQLTVGQVQLRNMWQLRNRSEGYTFTAGNWGHGWWCSFGWLGYDTKEVCLWVPAEPAASGTAKSSDLQAKGQLHSPDHACHHEPCFFVVVVLFYLLLP